MLPYDLSDDFTPRISLNAPTQTSRAEVPTRDEHHGPIRVLIVDEAPMVADTLGEILIRAGFHVAIAYSETEASAKTTRFQPDCLVVDTLGLGRVSLTFATQLKDRIPDIKVLVFSGSIAFLSNPQQERFRDLGFELIEKPAHPVELIRRIITIRQVD